MMKSLNSLKDIVDLLFLSTPFTKSMICGCERCVDFLVLSGQFGPRWIVPSCSYQGKKVLSQWHPYTLQSKIKWKGILLLYSLGLLHKFPGIKILSIRYKSFIKISGIIQSFIPIIYVGTPGNQQKIVVTMVSPDNGRPITIMKMALKRGAWTSLYKESMHLEKLSTADVPNVPVLLAVEEDNKRIWQTVINGKLTSRRLTLAHIDWLLCLPKSTKTTTLNEQKKIFENKIGINSTLFENYIQALSTASIKLKDREIPLILVHGDFVPWNLKLQPDGTISVIDWEDADWAGIPLWDICHFFLMQGYLFKEKNVIKKIIYNPLVHKYLMEMGICKKELPVFILLYIFLKASGIKYKCAKPYRQFLISQIPLVIEL